MNRRWLILITGILLLAGTNFVSAQLGSTINLRDIKPADYAKKILRAEKTGYGDLGKFQELLQNTFTHFNYLFNANKRMQQLIKEAMDNYQEDYTQLLSFYPYDEKALSKNAFLDSVIQHATAGLLLHDLRNDYVDELYFLLGKSYYFEQKYDTAHQIFQYLNYAFAPKDDGYDLPIGSNISKNPGVFTIMNPEKKKLGGKGYKGMQRRNDALIWQVRNYIQTDDYVQSAVLLDYLQKDIQLPSRLVPLLYETRAFFFYKQQQFDSAAVNLVKTNYTPYPSAQKARAYFLTGQLFALAKDSAAAARYFGLAKSRAASPVLSIYAALEQASLQTETAAGTDQTHIELLAKLSRKEKYARYKDVIYYAEATILKDHGQSDQARKLLMESIRKNLQIQPPNPGQKSRSYFVLAGMDYAAGSYYDAAHHYDSVSSGDLTDSLDRHILQVRSAPLNHIKDNTDSIKYQDSLLTLAALPEKQRYQVLRDKARDIRKAISKKQQAEDNNLSNPAIRNQATADLFPNTETTGVDWYFNNASLKSNGFNLFKQKFGNRPNVDNWQRINAITGTARPGIKDNGGQGLLAAFNPDGSLKLDSASITPEDLLKTLPLTAEAKATANQKIADNLFKNGQVLQNSLENFSGAIAVYDSLILQYPHADLIAEALFNQYVCWTLLGKKQNGDLVKNRLNAQFPNSKWNAILQKEGQKIQQPAVTSLQDSGTQIYNDIYQLFVEGDFAQAYARKAAADQKYGSYYWTPQLLYIEAIYNVTERKDSVAMSRLTYLINHFGNSPMKTQAATMLRVLQHRKEIEAYLNSLQITPNGYWENNRLARLENAARALDSTRERRIGLLKNQQILATIDSIGSPEQLSGELSDQNRQLALQQPVVTAPREEQNIQEPQQKALPDTTAVAAAAAPAQPEQRPSPATDTTSAKKQVAPQEDSFVSPKGVETPKTPPTAVTPEAGQTPARKAQTIDGFHFDPQSQHYTVILLHKVAQVFAAEAANAFNRYNLLAFEHEKFAVTGQKVGDYDIVLIGPFPTFRQASDYQQLIQPATAGTILPWLTPDKYRFISISPENLDKLKSNEDITNYLNAWAQFEAK